MMRQLLKLSMLDHKESHNTFESKKERSHIFLATMVLIFKIKEERKSEVSKYFLNYKESTAIRLLKTKPIMSKDHMF